eukprot:13408235-Alexandrium_andersonii.AAC.1
MCIRDSSLKSDCQRDQEREEGWCCCENQAIVRNALLEALGDKSAACEYWNLLNTNPSHRNDVLLLTRSPVADAD